MTDEQVIRLMSPRLVFFEKDKNGAFRVVHIGDCGGFILSEEETNAIIDFCLKDKETYKNQEERDFKNWQYGKEIEDERKRREALAQENKRAKKLAESNGEFKCTIYLMKDTIRGFVKIGMTNSLDGRFSQLRTANPAIEILKTYAGATTDEKVLHGHFKKLGKRVDGEWFSLGNSDLEYIDNYFTSKAA